MNWRLLKFVIAVELLTSLVLYVLAPTDSVRVWYPSAWAYVGEHALVWVASFAVLLGLTRKSPSVRPDALIVLAGTAAEWIATAYVWFVIPSSGEVSRAWYTRKFADYFAARIVAWCLLAIVAAIFYVTPIFRRWRREQSPTSSGDITGRT